MFFKGFLSVRKFQRSRELRCDIGEYNRTDLILLVCVVALTCRNGGRKNKDTHRGRITSYRIGYGQVHVVLLASIFTPFSVVQQRSIAVLHTITIDLPTLSSSSRDSTRNPMP